MTRAGPSEQSSTIWSKVQWASKSCRRWSTAQAKHPSTRLHTVLSSVSHGVSGAGGGGAGTSPAQLGLHGSSASRSASASQSSTSCRGDRSVRPKNQSLRKHHHRHHPPLVGRERA